MVTHLFHARDTNVITGARGIHTYCGEVVTEDSPDYAALRDYEPDHTANFFATIVNDIPDLCEACRRSILSPKTYHIESDDGLTYCGEVAAEVWLGGPFIPLMCEVCEEGSRKAPPSA